MKCIFKKTLTILTILFLVGTSFSLTVSAESKEGNLPFSVEPIYPENQKKDVNGYIYIDEKGKVNQPLHFNIQNHSEETIEVEVNPVNAYTSPSGVIQYKEKEANNSKITNPDYELKKYLNVKESVITLHENENKTIEIDFNTKEGLEGMILGGISFSLKDSKDEAEAGEENTFTINNKVNVIIGVMAELSEVSEVEFELQEPFFQTMPSYYTINLPIENKTPVYSPNNKVNYTVSYKGEELFSGETELDFAPHTNTNFAFPYEHEEIEKGKDYEIKGELITEDGTKENFNYHVKYEGKEEESISSTASSTSSIEKPEEKSQMSFWVFGLASIVLLIVLLMIFKRRTSKEQH